MLLLAAARIRARLEEGVRTRVLSAEPPLASLGWGGDAAAPQGIRAQAGSAWYPMGQPSRVPRISWGVLAPLASCLGGLAYLCVPVPGFLGQLSHKDNNLVVHVGRVWGEGGISPFGGVQEDAVTVRWVGELSFVLDVGRIGIREGRKDRSSVLVQV